MAKPCDYRKERIGRVTTEGCGATQEAYRCIHDFNSLHVCTATPYRKSPIRLNTDDEAPRLLDGDVPNCHRCEYRSGQEPKPPVPRGGIAKSDRSFHGLLTSLTIQDDVFFVDIGSYDGMFQNEFRDYVMRHGWSGIMVEPVKPYFEALQAGMEPYESVKTVHAAVTASNGTTRMKVIDDAVSPEWLKGSATVADRQREMCRGPEWREETVPAMSLDTLLDGVEKIDAICIDAEGCDWDIFEQLSLEKYRPTAIKIELGNLTHDEKVAVQKKLRKHGYRYWETDKGWDLVAMPMEAMSPRVDIVVPCIEQDLKRFEILNKSLDKFSSIQGERYLIVPPTQIESFKNFDGWNIVCETELIPRPIGSGWFIQQALKLAAHTIVDTPFYLLLDADCFATRPVSHKDLVVDGRGLMDYRKAITRDLSHLSEAQRERRAQRIANRRLHKADASQSQPWYRIPADLLGCPMATGAINVTPFVMNRAIAKLVGERLTALHGWNNPWQELLRLQSDPSGGSWTEYTLYQTYAQWSGTLFEQHVNCADIGSPSLNANCVWVRNDAATWEAEMVFDGGSFFSLVQSRTRLPASWTWERIKGWLE